MLYITPVSTIRLQFAPSLQVFLVHYESLRRCQGQGVDQTQDWIFSAFTFSDLPFFHFLSQFFSCSGNVYLSLLFLTAFPRMDSVILICGALVWKGRYTLHTTAFPPTLDSPALFGLAFLLRCSLDFFPPHFLLLITFTSFVSTQVGIG